MWNDLSHLTVMVLNVYNRLVSAIKLLELIPEITLTSVITVLLLKAFLSSKERLADLCRKLSRYVEAFYLGFEIFYKNERVISVAY